MVDSIWGVRTGTVFAQSRRVQEAIFRLPHLTRCGLDFAEPGGEFHPSLLAVAPKLSTVIIIADLSRLRLLPTLPPLRHVVYIF